MRFEEAYEGWNQGRLNQEEAAELLGMCARSFRRTWCATGPKASPVRWTGVWRDVLPAEPLDEVLALQEQYRERYGGWNVWHFFSHYKADGGKRKGQHRKKREHKPLPGQWHDLIVTMDDTTGEVYSMFLVEEEGTASSFQGMREGGQVQSDPVWACDVAVEHSDDCRIFTLGARAFGAAVQDAPGQAAEGIGACGHHES